MDMSNTMLWSLMMMMMMMECMRVVWPQMLRMTNAFEANNKLRVEWTKTLSAAFDPAATSAVLLYLEATLSLPRQEANPISLTLCIPTPVPRCATCIVQRCGWSDWRLELSGWEIDFIWFDWIGGDELFSLDVYRKTILCENYCKLRPF